MGNNSSTVTDGAVGGINNKPQNEGKPFDPNNIGSQYTETDGEEFVLQPWAIIAIIAGAVVLVAGGVVVTVIVVKKKKAK